MSGPKKVGVLIFDEVEVLDFCGPFEAFSDAGELIENSFKVVTIAQKSEIVSRNELKISPTFVIGEDEIPHLDFLIVPGGHGSLIETKNEALIEWIKSVASSAKVLSVCTGVALLGKAGLIDGMTVTTHHLCYEMVAEHCPKSTFCKCRRFVDNGNVLTSAGVSAGIDLSLYVIKKNHGIEGAKKTAEYMEYEWKDSDPHICTCTNA